MRVLKDAEKRLATERGSTYTKGRVKEMHAGSGGRGNRYPRPHRRSSFFGAGSDSDNDLVVTLDSKTLEACAQYPCRKPGVPESSNCKAKSQSRDPIHSAEGSWVAIRWAAPQLGLEELLAYSYVFL